MAFSFSPKVVTNGLVFCLDAANTRSYPGTGTVWSDLTNNRNNGTLTNGPTFNSANAGSIVFDGIDDCVTSFSSQIIGIESKTISCFIYPTKNTRGGICGTRPLAGSQGWVFAVNRTSAGNLTYYHTGGSLIEVNAGISINSWQHVCITYSTTTEIATLYRNGNQVGLPSSSFSVATPSTFNGIIGREDAGTTQPFQGNIANVQIYNRALSATEVLQNYNALKGRFNIT